MSSRSSSTCFLVLALLAGCLAVATARDHSRFYRYNAFNNGNGNSYRYYVVYFYYKDGYYPSNPGDWFGSYFQEYRDNYRSWFGGQGRGIYGYKTGSGPNYNPGYTKFPGSWGGYAYFNSYYDAYNFAWNGKYGLYSGWYSDGSFNYENGFRGAVPGQSFDTTGQNVGNDPQGTGFQIRGADVAPAPQDIQTIF